MPRQPSVSGIAELHVVKFTIGTIPRQQFVVGTFFDDTPLDQNEYTIGMRNGREAMGNDECGPSFHEVFEGFLHDNFSLGIQSGGRLVQDQNRCIFQQRPGNADTLFFTAGQADCPTRRSWFQSPWENPV